MSDIKSTQPATEAISQEQSGGNDETSRETDVDSKPDDSTVEVLPLAKNDEFLSPSLPPIAGKTQKKPNGKPVSLTIKSRFAIPADIYKAPKVAAFIAAMPQQKKKSAEESSASKSETTFEEDAGEAKSKETKPKAPPAKLTYQSPNWGKEPDDGKYSLEVLKNGSIVDNVKLSGKSHFLVGRLPDCDIRMEHPSISRYHAVLQFGSPDSDAEDVELQKDGTSGFYVYDLGSTHGTIINKVQVRSKLFYRIKVGHVVKFGGSTRMFILQGPDEDQEEEAKESATELRKLNKIKIKKKKDLEKMMLGEDSSSDEEEGTRRRTQMNGESSGVTWGMLEDAVNNSSDEEEESEEAGDTRADHPDAILVQTKKDPFYMKDPVKAIKNLYEREKLEPDFECSERRSGHWHVKLCLPVDGPSGKPVYAEVNATGKKKDTIRQCALEACRILEKHSMFHHKDHQKQRVKQWEDDDFYDSGEDEFHDRTGELEMKRKLRMQRAGKKSKGGKSVETYDSLHKKMTELDNEVKDIEEKLEKDKAVTKVSADAVDPLDAFMQQVKSGKALDTTTRSKLKRRLLEARKEHMRVVKLADLARPSSLPPLQSSLLKNYAFVGKMKGRKKPISTISATIAAEDTKEIKEGSLNDMEEFDDDESRSVAEKHVRTIKLLDKIPEADTEKSAIDQSVSPEAPARRTSMPESKPVHSTKSESEQMDLDLKTETAKSENHTTGSTSNVEVRVLGPSVPDELRRRLSSETDVLEQNLPEDEAPEPKRRRKRQRIRVKKLDQKAEQYSDDPKYSGWIPPERSDSLLPDRLEESLSCDDLFLEYFNVFLNLPSFPLRLRYDRLTGTFHQLPQSIAAPDFNLQSKANPVVPDFVGTDSVHGLPGAPPYGAKDDEKERLLIWAHKYRLPLFWQTRLHREFKLLKLLLRPLDYRRGSSRIRGYSRLSMGTTATSFTPNESPDPDNQSSIAWTDGQTIKKVSYLMGPMEQSRPNSHALSLPPDIGGRTWSATAMYDTSATETSSSTPNEVASWQKRHAKSYRGSNTDDKLGDIDPGVSDSGLGTTALDYATTVGTSAKTRNIGTRADTLGVGSRWESEYSTRTHTEMTNSTFHGSGQISGTSTPTIHSGTRYEGKSAMRTADTPSKPHRATIILPGSGNKTSVGSDEVSKQRLPESEAYDADFDTVVDGVELDDDEDDVSGFLEFDDRESSCDETEVEIESIQKVHQMKLQHIKDRLLGTKEGMDNFLNFLSETGGISLLSFWLDAEAFKDALERASEGRSSHSVEDMKSLDDVVSTTSDLSAATDEGAVLAWRHRLFRDILERHKFSLTEEASEQIREAQSNLGLTCHVFGRTQYDALRRLRSYWLPRYIVHCSTRADFDKRLCTGLWDKDVSSEEKLSPRRYTFLPLLTIGHFIPGVRLDKDRSEPGELTVRPLETLRQQGVVERPSTARIRAMSAKSAAHHLLLKALASELDAGCPFRQYLIDKGDKTVRNAYDLWVTLEHMMEQSDQGGEEAASTRSLIPVDSSDFSVDALDAWKIFSNFVWPVKASKSINLPEGLHAYAKSLDVFLRRAVTKHMESKTRVASSVFKPAKLHALSVLSQCWKEYCKREMKGFLEAREGRSIPSSSSTEVPPSPPRSQKPAKKSRQFDEMSTTISESTTIFSKPWLTDDEDTETDSASTMYSYDVERIKQIAAIIRQRGAKKPQRSPPKRPPPLRRRIPTAAKSVKSVTKEKDKKGSDTISESSKTSKKKQTKVQFSLPDRADSQNTSKITEADSLEGRDERVDDDDATDKRKKKKKKSLFHRHADRMTYHELKENKLYLYFRKYVAQCESMEVQNVFQMYALCDVIKTLPMTEATRRSALSNELARTYLSSTGPKQIAISSEFLTPFMNELPNPSPEVTEALQLYVLPTLNQAAANFSLGFSTALKEYKLDLRSDFVANAMKAELALRTLTLKPSSKRRRALGKHSARQPATTDHKQSFLEALKRASEGDLPLELLHFYKYLQGFGSQEGFPLIHNDLLFYVEVSKFLACFHEAYDLVTLKRKVQSIIDCFITSSLEPTLQIDIKTGTAERLRRASESFVNDKGRDPHTDDLFEDAQHTVFNELLPFWAGYASARPLAERDEKRPVLKAERLHKRRLDAFLRAPDPKTNFNIPKSIPKFDMHGIEFTFSVNGGIQWKEWSEISSSRSNSPPPEGIIEIVKMPPKGQNRRMVRRGNYNAKKLNAIHERVTISTTTTSDKKQQVHHKQNKSNGGRARNIVTNINYATSVS